MGSLPAPGADGRAVAGGRAVDPAPQRARLERANQPRGLLDADEQLKQERGSLLPQLQFRLIDLTHEGDKVLRAWLTTDLGKLVALCLKHAPYDSKLERRLPEWLDLFGNVVRAQGGVAGLDVVGRYLLEVNAG